MISSFLVSFALLCTLHLDVASSAASPRIIRISSLSKMTSRQSCWVSVYGTVYDITTFVDRHPGGSGILMRQCGTEIGDMFDSVGHPKSALKHVEKLMLGVLEKTEQDL